MTRGDGANPQVGDIIFTDGSQVAINKDTPLYGNNYPVPGTLSDPWAYPPSTVQETFWVDDWNWSCGVWSGFGFLHRIPAGTKNFMFNLGSTISEKPQLDSNGNVFEDKFDNDIQLFTMNGAHLAGTPLSDVTYTIKNYWARHPRLSEVSNIESYSPWLGFTEADYDGTQLNSGPADYDTGPVDNSSLNWSTYNGMRIGYSGDGNLNNDGKTQAGNEVLVIDGEVTEDLLIWVPGDLNVIYRMYWDGGRTRPEGTEQYRGIMAIGPTGLPVSVETQEQAQQALERIDSAIVKKDKIRANLGAMQNRLENTVTNLNVQAENLQAAEARISDADIAAEMTSFVRSQILTQSAVAMLTQANSLPRMAMQIIG